MKYALFGAALFAMCNPAYAESAPATPPNAPYEKTATTFEMVLQGRQDFLSSLYDAQIALHNKDASLGAKHIEAALAQLEELDDYYKLTGITTDKVLYNSLRRVIELDLGSALFPERAVLPLTNQNLTGATLFNSIDMTKLEEGAIKQATIRYIAFDIDISQFRDKLQQALKEISGDDLYGAQYDLLQVQRDMLEDIAVDTPPILKARDNVALTRFMIAHREYGAAEKALNEVQTAIDALESSEQPRLIDRIRAEIAMLRSYIKSKEMAKDSVLDTEFDSWWE